MLVWMLVQNQCFLAYIGSNDDLGGDDNCSIILRTLHIDIHNES